MGEGKDARTHSRMHVPKHAMYPSMELEMKAMLKSQEFIVYVRGTMVVLESVIPRVADISNSTES